MAITGLLNKGITLTHKEKLLEGLQSTPDLGGTPEKVEVTTFEDGEKRYIPGLKDNGDLEFKFLYENGESSAFRTLKTAELANAIDPYKVTLPDGTAFGFNAGVAVKLGGQEPNNPLTFTATLTLNSGITVTHPTAPTGQ